MEHELIAELRMLFIEPSIQNWRKIIQIFSEVDGRDEHVQMALDYARVHLEPWPKRLRGIEDTASPQNREGWYPAVKFTKPNEYLFELAKSLIIRREISEKSAKKIQKMQVLEQIQYLELSAIISQKGLQNLLQTPLMQDLHALKFVGTLQYQIVQELLQAETLSSLFELDLSEATLDSESCFHIAEHLHFPRLTSVLLCSKQLSHEHIETFVQNPSIATLTELALHGTKPYMEWYEWDDEEYPQMPEDWFLPVESIQELAKCPHLQGLKSLDLSGCAMGCEGIYALRNSPFITKLEELVIAHEQLNNGALNLLTRNPKLFYLKRLKLQDCKLDDNSYQLLTKSPYLSALEELHIEGNLLSTQGIQALADSPNLPNLHSLVITEEMSPPKQWLAHTKLPFDIVVWES